MREVAQQRMRVLLPLEGTARGVLRVVEQLAGAVVPASALERLILPSRIADYSPTMLDELESNMFLPVADLFGRFDRDLCDRTGVHPRHGDAVRYCEIKAGYDLVPSLAFFENALPSKQLLVGVLQTESDLTALPRLDDYDVGCECIDSFHVRQGLHRGLLKCQNQVQSRPHLGRIQPSPGLYLGGAWADDKG